MCAKQEIVHEIDQKLRIGTSQERGKGRYFHHVLPPFGINEEEGKIIRSTPLENRLAQVEEISMESISCYFRLAKTGQMIAQFLKGLSRPFQ